METCPRMRFRTLTVLTILCALLLPQSVWAAEHVVTSDEMHQALLRSSETRQQNLEKLEGLLATEPGRAALEQARLDGAKVSQAAAALSDAELARLAERAVALEKDFAAGQLTNQQITYILIAVVTAIVVLILV